MFEILVEVILYRQKQRLLDMLYKKMKIEKTAVFSIFGLFVFKQKETKRKTKI